MKTGDVVWVAGHVLDDYERCKSSWGLAGVFTEEFLAVEACINKNYFIGPAILNEALPEEVMKWRGAYYPKLETRYREPLTNTGEVNED